MRLRDWTGEQKEIAPFTLTEIEELESDYRLCAIMLDWRKRRRTRRNIADEAFLRLVVTVRMFATGCVGLAAQLPPAAPDQETREP